MMGYVSRFMADRLALAAAVLLTMLLALALFGHALVPQNPYDIAQLDILDARLPPGSHAESGGMHYWLGTDDQGRDLLSAMVYGLRTSVLVGLISTVCAASIGLLLGLTAAWHGRWLSSLILRLADIQLSFPSLLLALILLAVSGPGLGKIILALVASQWAYYTRTARAAALVEMGKPYLDSARVLGVPPLQQLWCHLLPNCLPTVLVVASLQIAAAISLEATLSFLGLGLPVTEPSLGLLIANGYQHLLSGQYWISLFPGLLLLSLVVSLNLVGDRLRQLAELRR